MRWLLIKIIEFYQKTLSPDHGIFRKMFPHGYCRFHPTCSEYTKRSIKRYGSLKGSLMGFWRINRCNPFSRGGVDEPEDEKSSRQALYGLIALLIYLIFLFMLWLVLKSLLPKEI